MSVACYICACMKLHATLLEGEDPKQPSTQLGYPVAKLDEWPFHGIHILSVFTQVLVLRKREQVGLHSYYAADIQLGSVCSSCCVKCPSRIQRE